MAAALALLGMAGVPSSARAGSYYVVQCHYWNRSFDQFTPDNVGGYTPYASKCAQNVPDYSYQLRSTGFANAGASATYTFGAPYGTAISYVTLSHDMRSADWHQAVIQVQDAGGWHDLYWAPNAPGGFVDWAHDGLWAWNVRVALFCANGNGCGQSNSAHAYFRNVQVRLSDPNNPSLSASGPLLSGAWQRGGANAIAASAADQGAGVSRLDVVVNGAPLGVGSGVNCNGQSPPYTIYKVPCGGAQFSVSPNTSAYPFHDGADNKVQVVADDFSGNRRVASYEVKVDNAPPSLAFANHQDPNDPELIRAPVSDRHSGVADATIYVRQVGAQDSQPLETQIKDGAAQARVDSLNLPAGEYELGAVAHDVAGNVALTGKREDGTAMRLAFPLKGAVEMRAHLNRGGSKGQTVRYGTKAKAKGMLLDAAGEPIVGQDVTIVEHFGAGTLIRERVSHATTDERGKWRSKVPAGPSRDVEATFGGTPKFAPAARGVGTFTVRSRASFKTSRRNVPEGRAVRFSGKVRHFGARIPSGGKLVELQVRMKTGRWDTVGEAFRTNEKGIYRRRYRFGKHYTSDALFHFRVKVKREAKWPYRRTTTGRRKVIVRAR